MKNKETQQKLRGGYYTPPQIAHFLVEWSFLSAKTKIKILEPSLGDGVFLEPLKDYSINKKIDFTGIELFKEELLKAKSRILNNDSGENIDLVHADFFSVYDKIKNNNYDIILGNPPFIRYQDFPENQRSKALEILKDIGFKTNKLTNAWLFFLLTCTKLLNETGKLAMVLPAELLQVKYAAETRKYLSNFFHSITIISFKNLLFEGTQQEVVLFLGDRNNEKNNGIDLIELNNVNELKGLAGKIKQPEHFKPIDHDNDKWLQYFLSKAEINLLREFSNNKKIISLGDVAEVDIGVVTGNNKFFVINQEVANRYQILDYCIPLVGRTEQLKKGVIFTGEDWTDNLKTGKDCYLIKCSDENDLSAGIKKYFGSGLTLGVHNGYKCSIRKLWYSVPSIWTPDAFLYRQIHQYPKIVLNNASAISTDTIHRVKFKDKTKSELVVSSFYNSMTLAFSEVYGRSYGGGVLELEPNEAEKLPLPYSAGSIISIDRINTILKNDGIEYVLDYVDEILLQEYLGVSKAKILMLREIWKKLSNRRINRKK